MYYNKQDVESTLLKCGNAIVIYWQTSDSNKFFFTYLTHKSNQIISDEIDREIERRRKFDKGRNTTIDNKGLGLLFTLALHKLKNQTWKEQKVHKFQLLRNIK